MMQLDNYLVRRTVVGVFGLLEEEAEDIAQETFLTAIKDLLFTFEKPMFNGNDFTGYLYRCLYSTAINCGKRYLRDIKMQPSLRQAWCLKRFTHNEGKLGDSRPSPPPEENLMKKEDSQSLRGAIAKLPERQQTVICMKFFEDMSYKEIAQAMGTSEFAARILMCRARSNLGRHLYWAGIDKSISYEK